jgi:hypothetical protein
MADGRNNSSTHGCWPRSSRRDQTDDAVASPSPIDGIHHLHPTPWGWYRRLRVLVRGEVQRQGKEQLGYLEEEQLLGAQDRFEGLLSNLESLLRP